MYFPEIENNYELDEKSVEEFMKTARQIADTIFGTATKKISKREVLDQNNNFASALQTAVYDDDAVIGFALSYRYFSAHEVLIPQDELGEVVMYGHTYELNINHLDCLDSLEVGLGTLSVECGGEVDFDVDQVQRSVTEDADRDIDDQLELEFTRDSRLMGSDLLALLDISDMLINQ